MKRTPWISVFVATAATALIGCSTSNSSQSSASLASHAAPASQAVCQGGHFRCFSRIRTKSGRIEMHAAATGFGPADLADAYKLDTSRKTNAVVAVVDAYGYANAESDLAAYRSNYGLSACTVANGCLTIVNQEGKTSPLPPAPPSGDDWTVETALDLDMASAACPNCKLLLVQADDDKGDGLFIAQKTAASLGATVISDSWGGPETATDPATKYESYFDVGSAGIFVAAGDSGYDNGGQGPDYPSTSIHVTAVGGTTLTKAAGTSRGWTETAWGSSIFGGAGGSSCSLSVPKPSWQGNTSCTFRAAADVSAVGDPASGLAVYNAGSGGWVSVGGTSAASPFVAAVYALTGHGGDAPSFAYSHTSDYFDATSGSNGTCGNILCNAGAGWDGPTGIGTPNGAALANTACTPDCSGKTCGNDGCGGSCGTCASGQVCSAAGQCGVCTPDCSGKTCGDDGCGGSCGSCANGQVCSSSGQCGAACTPNCTGKTCGDDGCGGVCGSCSNGQTCSSSGQCTGGNGCTPVCSAFSAQCGDDGCGGSCGTCSGGTQCFFFWCL